MFALFLNPMTSNCENAVCVAIADTDIKLEEFIYNERVEPYNDIGTDHFNDGNKQYNKSFKKAGPLEWFNPPEMSYCEPNGIIEIPSLEDFRMEADKWIHEMNTTWNYRYGQALQL